ncbi:MAG: hypothetical protein HOO06_06560 [Bdellovibrionaceae bacterium]|jgi:hypothetical protein|nr:hypothetical protein [Pseudobdellovibrionaceae bacterium]
MNFLKIYFLILGLLFTSSLRAEYFVCDFTEPFFRLYIAHTSDYQKVSSSDEVFYTTKGPHVLSRGTDIVSYKKSGFQRNMTLKSGQEIKLWRNVVGNDGMSDRYYPFEVKFGRFYGGCSSEDYSHNIVMERWTSWRAIKGTSFVNAWPGEFAEANGFKSLKRSAIPSEHTWTSLKEAELDKKVCTIPAGKQYVPKNKARHNIYAHLSPTTETMTEQGQEFELAFLGDGLCYAETTDGIQVKACRDLTDHPEPQVDYGNLPNYPLPDFGSYLFTQCEEGHYTWINTEAFKYSDNFEAVQLAE